MINSKLEMAQAITQLNQWTYYYDLGIPKVSDKEWDALYYELEEAEKRLGYSLPNSPTQNVIYSVVSNLEKVVHNHPLLSLAKTKNKNEFLNYFQPNKEVVGMLKLDGLTCSLHYKNGELIGAETRGNGTVGDNVLHNIQHIKNIPLTIDYQDELIIDGEVICTYENFKQFQDAFANPRNFAAGSLRLLDSKEFATRNLIFVVWYVAKGFNNTNSLLNKFDLLENMHFTIVPHTASLSAGWEDYLVNLAKEKSYPIDGLVGRYNDIQFGDSLGATGHHMRSGFAFKFYDDEYETELLDIEFTMGRTGELTPTAVFKPVDTGDSIVERASLHNISVMYDTMNGGAYVGEKISVAKMNQIIPQIVKAEHKFPPGVKCIPIPTTCPICGHPLTTKTSATNVKTLWCLNSHCAGKLINKLDYFCGKNGLDIKGLSINTLDKLMQNGWLNNILDIFNLHTYAQAWIQQPGFGMKSVQKILNNIDNCKNGVEAWRIISSLGIPLIGAANAKEIVKYFSVIEFINAAETNYNFTKLDGFGDAMNQAIHNFDFTEIKTLLNKQLIVELKNNPLNNTQGMLYNKSFVITGSVNLFQNREELKLFIEHNGGTVVSAVSNKTSYLINNDINSNSTKNIKAKNLNIPIITEQQLMEMIENG